MKSKNCMERKIRLRTVNQYITCILCKGYYIDATTITECLHTFCRSCIVRYLEAHNTCPTCGIQIHQSHPLHYISHDRTMQDIVFKLVPNLQAKEHEQELKFYESRGLPVPRPVSVNKENGEVESHPETNNNDCHRNDDQINICLDCQNHQMKMLKRKFLRCSSHTTITHLKKFIAIKLYNKLEKSKNVEILCNDEIIGSSHTLNFVWLTRWRIKEQPLTLVYRPKVQL